MMAYWRHRWHTEGFEPKGLCHKGQAEPVTPSAMEGNLCGKICSPVAGDR